MKIFRKATSPGLNIDAWYLVTAFKGFQDAFLMAVVERCSAVPTCARFISNADAKTRSKRIKNPKNCQNNISKIYLCKWI